MQFRLSLNGVEILFRLGVGGLEEPLLIWEETRQDAKYLCQCLQSEFTGSDKSASSVFYHDVAVGESLWSNSCLIKKQVTAITTLNSLSLVQAQSSYSAAQLASKVKRSKFTHTQP